MIRQFIVEPIVDVALARTPFKELNEHLWRTQLALTNIMGQTNYLQFWRHDGLCSKPMLVVESSFMVIEHFV